MEMMPKITLDEGLDLRKIKSTGSVLQLNTIYDDCDTTEQSASDTKIVDMIGKPVKNFELLAESMSDVDSNGFVKKLILEEGGGLPFDENNTVSVAFSAYWENEKEPFDAYSSDKPLKVDLKDNGVLPGLAMALRSMLVGELSIFLFSHEKMYGELGIPPRIKPAAQCVFFIKLIKSVVTKQEQIIYSEPNMFQRVNKEVKMLYSSGTVLFKAMNFPLATNLFKKAVDMLHKCRLADEDEEKVQEKLLIKLYINLAICYNKTKQPLKVCIACNELNRLNSLWNNGKALFQNAKALRMIGQYDCAEKRLLRAIKLCPKTKTEDMKAELELLRSTRDSCNQSRLIGIKTLGPERDLVNDMFKQEVDNLIQNFKVNVNLCKLTLPEGLNSDELKYVKQACIRENLFFNRIPQTFPLDTTEDKSLEKQDHSFAMEKQDESSDLKSEPSDVSLNVAEINDNLIDL